MDPGEKLDGQVAQEALPPAKVQADTEPPSATPALHFLL